MVEVLTYAASVQSYPPRAGMPLHSHSEPSIGFVLAGTVRETTPLGEEEAGPGSLVLKAAGLPHANAFGRSGALMVGTRVSPALQQWLNVEWRWLHGRLAAQITFRLASEVIAGDRFGAAEESLLTLLQESSLPAPAGPPPAAIARVRDVLHDQPCRRPSVVALASDVGLHPVYLTRRFRQFYQTSISGYTRRLRARLAAERLAAGYSATLVAHDLDFADHSHLHRIFLAEFGITPSRYQRLVRAASASG
jgi:AraC family transcriptional regulator